MLEELYRELIREIHENINATEAARLKFNKWAWIWFLIITVSSTVVAIINVLSSFAKNSAFADWDKINSVLPAISAVIAVVSTGLATVSGRGNYDTKKNLQLEIHQLYVDLQGWLRVNWQTRVKPWGLSYEAQANADNLLREAGTRESNLRKRRKDAI